MVTALTMIALVIAAVVVVVTRNRRSPNRRTSLLEAAQPSAGPGDAETMQQLRRYVLETVPPFVSSDDVPYLTLMDMRHNGAVMSLMSSSTGDASLYCSAGSGILGGIHSESIQAAAKAFFTEVAAHRDQFSLARDLSYPNEANVRFFLRTGDNIYMADADGESIAVGTSPFTVAFRKSHDVFTLLRQAAGR